MKPMQVAKAVLALAGVVVFMGGVRSHQELLRWTGIALVASAWSLRFLKSTKSSEDV